MISSNNSILVFIDFEATKIDKVNYPYVISLKCGDKDFKKIYKLDDLFNLHLKIKIDLENFFQTCNPKNLKINFISWGGELETKLLKDIFNNNCKFKYTIINLSSDVIANNKGDQKFSQSTIEKLLNMKEDNSLDTLINIAKNNMSDNEFFYERLRKNGKFANWIGQIYYQICNNKRGKFTEFYTIEMIEEAMVKYNWHDVCSMLEIYERAKVNKIEIPINYFELIKKWNNSYKFLNDINNAFNLIKNSQNNLKSIINFEKSFKENESNMQKEIIEIEEELCI